MDIVRKVEIVVAIAIVAAVFCSVILFGLGYTPGRLYRRWFTEIGRLEAQEIAIQRRLDRIEERAQGDHRVQQLRESIERKTALLAEQAFERPQHFAATEVMGVRLEMVLAHLRARYPGIDNELQDELDKGEGK